MTQPIDPSSEFPFEREENFAILRSELEQVTCGALNVHVDFNELLGDKGDQAYEIVAKLKDLLG